MEKQEEQFLTAVLIMQATRTTVQSPEEFMGMPEHYAMMGVSKSIHRCFQVTSKSVDIIAACQDAACP